MQLIVEGQLLAKDENPHGYSSYIVKVKSLPEDLKSIYLTDLLCIYLRPNWGMKNININDIGYFKIENVISGKNFYYVDEEKVYYKSSGLFLENFTLKKEEIDNLNIKF